MNSNLSRSKHLTAWILSLAVLLAAESVLAKDDFEWRATVNEPVELDVDTGSGSIRVRSGPGDEVIVIGEVHVSRRFFGLKPGDAEELVQQVRDNPPVELKNGKLRVGEILDRQLRKRVSISYDITVPARTAVSADSGSGSISIADIDARVEADTGSGSVTLENIGGPVVADTGSGSIRADGVAGAFNGSTGSGSIYLRQTSPGDVEVSTGSGSSELTGVAGSVRANSGSGRITIDGDIAGEWRLDTGSGSVFVTLPADAAFDFDAESNSGGIDIEHPLTVEGRISKRRVTGTVRGGGPLLHVDTGSGGIRVR